MEIDLNEVLTIIGELEVQRRLLQKRVEELSELLEAAAQKFDPDGDKDAPGQ